jgi:hypothetical protein
MVAPPETAQRNERSLFWAAGTEAVTLVALAGTLAVVVMAPAVSAETMATEVVSAYNVPPALTLAARLTVPAASATN